MNNSFKERAWMEKYKKEQQKREKIITAVVGTLCIAMLIGTFAICNAYTKDSIKKCMEHHSLEECFAHA